MNQSDLKQIQERAAKAQKPEEFQEVFASFKSFAEIIMEESERRAEEAKQAKAQAQTLADSEREAKAKHEQVVKDLDALQARLVELQRAQAATEARQVFDQRMTAVADIFDLQDAETRAFFAEEVRSCENDEAFAKKVDKFKKIMKEKVKKTKDDKDADDKANAGLVKAALESKGFKVTLAENGLDFKEILASAKDDVTSTHLVNSMETRPSIKDQAKEAFKDVTIGGRKISQLAKKE